MPTFEVDGYPILSKVDMAYRSVKRWILTGALPPGSDIDQSQLAEQLSLSTTPVREALRRLEVEGFVVLVARSAARVRELDPAEFDNLLDVRLQLEPVAAEMAAGRATAAERERAAGLARAIGASAVEQQQINRQFHRAIYVNCGNEVMAHTLDAMYDHCDRYSLALLEVPSDYGRLVGEEHVVLAQAYLDEDAAGLRELMRAHLANSLSLCTAVPNLAADPGSAAAG